MGSFGGIMIIPWKKQALDHPDRIWIRTKNTEFTYGDLANQILIYADHFQKYLNKGSRVGIWKQDIITTITLFFAILECDCTAVIFSDRDPKEKTDRQSQYILLDHMIEDPLSINPNDKISIVDRLGEDQSDQEKKIILFTSGSTKKPKAVLHSLATLIQNAEASHKNIPFEHGHTWLLSLSLWHVGGLAIVIRSMLYGACIAVGSIEDIGILHVTHVSFVALQLRRFIDLCHRSEVLKTSLQCCLVGGGPTHQNQIQQAVQMGIPIHTTYGMTELGSQMFTTPPLSNLKTLQSSGSILEGWKVRFSEYSEIQVKGPALFLGYVHGRDLDPCRDDEGFFSTGDCGYMEDDLLFISGRRDLMFISGGENIYPQRIEEKILNITGIICCIVVDVPNIKYGSRPIAVLCKDAKFNICDSSIEKNLLSHLPKFAIPDYFIPWPSDYPLPEHSKPSRSFLRQYARTYLQIQLSTK